MACIQLSKRETEEYMMSIKHYFMQKMQASKNFSSLTPYQKKFFNRGVFNFYEVVQFTELFKEILESIRQNSKAEMTKIIDEYLFHIEKETKKKVTADSILGENWEEHFLLFDNVPKIKDNIQNQIILFHKQAEFRSIKLNIYSKLDESTELFHNGFISNLFLRKYPPTEYEFKVFDFLKVYTNEKEYFRKEKDEEESDEEEEINKNDSDQSTEKYTLEHILKIMQSNKATKLTEKVEPMKIPFQSINNSSEIKSKSEDKNQKEEERERKLKAYRKAYIQKRKEKINELIQRKKEEKKAEKREEFRKNYVISQMLKKKELIKFQNENENMQEYKNQFIELVNEIQESKLIDLSKIKIDDPFAIQKALQEKIDEYKSFDLEKAKDDLQDADDFLFQRKIILQQTHYRFMCKKEEVENVQKQKEIIRMNNPLEISFLMYSFILKYRKTVLCLPQTNNLLYPRNYKDEFDSLVNKNGLEWLVKELRSLF